MSDGEVIVFSTPTCPVCRKVERLLADRGVTFRSLDVSADRGALTLLLRIAGQATVPTVIACGEVMVGFDPHRLDEMLEGLAERAEAWERERIEEEDQLRRNEELLRRLEEEDES